MMSHGRRNKNINRNISAKFEEKAFSFSRCKKNLLTEECVLHFANMQLKTFPSLPEIVTKTRSFLWDCAYLVCLCTLIFVQ